MRVLVYGGRDFADKEWLFAVLDEFHVKRPITELIEGGQRTRDPETLRPVGGADYWAMQWAKQAGIARSTYFAEWKRLGKRAGVIRNQRMLDEGKPECGIEFPGGNGTADMHHRLAKAGIEIVAAVKQPESTSSPATETTQQPNQQRTPVVKPL